LSLSSYFLSPVHIRRGSKRAVLVGTWHLSRPNQNIQTHTLQESEIVSKVFVLKEIKEKRLEKDI